MKLQQCMGGWCSVHEKCAHFWAPEQPGVRPSERLCMPQADGEAMVMRPIELVPDAHQATMPRHGLQSKPCCT